jgi:hypothetical protein
MQPTPRRKEQEHNICAMVVVPKPGMARMAMSKAMETPAYQGKVNEGFLVRDIDKILTRVIWFLV